jgi:eukaryotic-like serine/threonine-protein kinase
MLGSPRYMSPEQAMGREIDGRSDIFSLGAVLYEMLTGHYAFDGDSLPTIVYRVIHETPVPAISLRPQLPPELAGLLARMLDKDPQARPDARQLVNALYALRPAASPLPAASPSDRISPLLPTLAFGMPVAVTLLIGVGIIVINYFLPASLTDAPTPLSPGLSISQDGASQPGAGEAPETPAPAGSAATGLPERPPFDESSDPYLAGLDKKQVELRIRRTELLLEYTTEHPDVVQIDRQLEQLRSERRRYLQQRQKG